MRFACAGRAPNDGYRIVFGMGLCGFLPRIHFLYRAFRGKPGTVMEQFDAMGFFFGLSVKRRSFIESSSFQGSIQ